MRELVPVRLDHQPDHQSGPRLVLRDAEGSEYSVPVDARLGRILGPLLGGTRVSPPGRRRERVETMESALRPRDIQQRIRAGESPDDVAAVAGTSVDRVMVYAEPVLAERAHVARTALSSSVRRTSPDPVSTERTLGVAASTRLRDEGVDPDSVDWDAWRRDDGRWTLVAAYHHDGEGRRARFVLDQPGRFVTADDDEGRWLVGDGSFPTRVEKEQATRRRLAPVPRYDEQLPLGHDAIELVREERARATDPDVGGTAAAIRSLRPHPPEPEPDAVTGDADWIAEEHAADVELIPEAEERALAEQEVGPPVDEPAEEPSPAPRAARKGRGRASVPSWDEIMFGGGRGE